MDTSMEVPADLDLSGLCYPLLGAVLFIIWWCQVSVFKKKLILFVIDSQAKINWGLYYKN
jgi:hypothetical protein